MTESSRERSLGVEFFNETWRLLESRQDDWDLAFAFETIARGYAVAGEQPEHEAYARLARGAGEQIADAYDRAHFERDLATVA